MITKIQQVFSEYLEIDSVTLYGSRAKGNYREGSDIDLTIMSRSLSDRQLFKIENELDDLLLPYKIDLSLFSHIENQTLIEHIERVGKLFYFKGQLPECVK